MLLEDVTDVFEAAENLLEEINEIFEEFSEQDGVTELPTRQFITVSPPSAQPHDCEQVTVTVSQLYSGIPGVPDQGPSGCDGPRSATFFVEVVRDTSPKPTTTNGRLRPVGMTPEQEMVQAKSQSCDLRLLLEAGRRLGDSRGIGSVASVDPGPESGGFQAMTLSVSIWIA